MRTTAPVPDNVRANFAGSWQKSILGLPWNSGLSTIAARSSHSQRRIRSIGRSILPAISLLFSDSQSIVLPTRGMKPKSAGPASFKTCFAVKISFSPFQMQKEPVPISSENVRCYVSSPLQIDDAHSPEPNLLDESSIFKHLPRRHWLSHIYLLSKQPGCWPIFQSR